MFPDPALFRETLHLRMPTSGVFTISLTDIPPKGVGPFEWKLKVLFKRGSSSTTLWMGRRQTLDRTLKKDRRSVGKETEGALETVTGTLVVILQHNPGRGLNRREQLSLPPFEL